MAKTLGITANLQVSFMEGQRPMPIPLAFAMAAYAQHEAVPVSFETAQTNKAINLGTSLTAPKVMLVEVESGTLDIKFDTETGTVPLRLSMDADPAPADHAFMLVATPVGATRTMYVSSPGAVHAKVWLFQ